jgi:hypothetical protein
MQQQLLPQQRLVQPAHPQARTTLPLGHIEQQQEVRTRQQLHAEVLRQQQLLQQAGTLKQPDIRPAPNLSDLVSNLQVSNNNSRHSRISVAIKCTQPDLLLLHTLSLVVHVRHRMQMANSLVTQQLHTVV